MHPLQIAVRAQRQLSALLNEGAGALTLLYLHDRGLDLDSIAPLAKAIQIPEAHGILMDLPGHGLSSGQPGECEDPDVAADLHGWLGTHAYGPVFVVAAGRSATLAFRMARLGGVFGVALVGPRCDLDNLGGHLIRVPTLAVIPTKAKDDVADWLGIRRRIGSPWLSASIATDHDDLVRSGPRFRSQVASHIKGFVREMFALHQQRSRALAGQGRNAG